MKKILFIMILNGLSLVFAGAGLHFDGIGDYINIGNNTSLNTGNIITIEAWICADDLSSRYTIYSTRSDNTAGSFQLEVGSASGVSGRIAVTGLNTWAAQTEDSVITTGEWVHIAYVRSGSGTGTHKIFVNGEEQTLISDADYDFIDNTSNKHIGSGTYGEALYPGKMDELRIWSVVRTADQIKDDMSCSLEGSENGLVSYFNMNESTGNTVVDCAGVNNGTMVNMDDSDRINYFLDKPVLINADPADNSSDIDNKIHPEMIFDRNMTAGEGSINIYEYADNSLFASVSAASVSVTDSAVTIDPGMNFDYGKKYYVLADSNSFMSDDSTYFSGIRDKDTWDFITAAVSYSSMNAGFIKAYTKSTALGDIDNDNDLDVVISYSDSVMIYYNDNSVFTPVKIDVYYDAIYSLELGDYDNDGDLDILMTGQASSSEYFAKIFRNDNGSFTDVQAGLTGVKYGCAIWGDYDNDGDLDIFAMGEETSGSSIWGSTTVYRNDSGVFTDINIPSYSYFGGDADWGDYDNDGDLDILLTGSNKTRIFRNDNGSFVYTDPSMKGYYTPSVSWGDYDNDGDLDALVSGTVYRNDNGTFTVIHAGLTGAQLVSSAWGDHDNDGDLDIIFTGYIEYGVYYTKLYENNGGVFAEKSYGFTNMYGGTVQWADIDDDGDLDLFMSGTGYASSRNVEIYRNNLSVYNNSPTMPSGLNAVFSADTLSFSYGGSSDIETPQDGLSYNIDIRTYDKILVFGNSDLNTGYRYLPSAGNAVPLNNYRLTPGDISTLPQERTRINWSVQAVDHCYKGSEFANQEFFIDISDDLTLDNKPEMYPGDILSWEVIYPDSISSFDIQIDTDSTFADPLVHNFNNTKKEGNKAYYGLALNELDVIDSLQNNVEYFWRLRPNYINRSSRYTAFPSNFVYDPLYGTPSPVNITVEGEYATISWQASKDKSIVYNIYSTDDPNAVFPEGWTPQAAVSGANEWITRISGLKKFYCVTAGSNE